MTLAFPQGHTQWLEDFCDVTRGANKATIEGIDYKKTIAPVTRYTSIRSIRAGMRWEIQKLDIQTTFLIGVIEEEVYIENPLVVETRERKTHV